jgi:hypothetical protein
MCLQHAHHDAADAGDDRLEQHQPHHLDRQQRALGLKAGRDGAYDLWGEDGPAHRCHDQ